MAKFINFISDDRQTLKEKDIDMSITLIMVLLIISVSSLIGQVAPPPDLDRYINQVRGTFDVPGISLAVVKDGQVVLAAGYGYKDQEKKDPVDDRTLFGIASNTKAFTEAGAKVAFDFMFTSDR